MTNPSLRIDRRKFVQAAAITSLGGMLVDLNLITEALAEACRVVVPGDPPIPLSYVQQRGLMALRADVLLRQLLNGYSYFGQPRNWTTLWSLNELTSAVQTILKNDLEISGRIDDLICSAESQIRVISSYDNAVSGAQHVQARLLANINDDNAKAIALLTVISDLARDIDAQKKVVDAAEVNFDSAVKSAATGGCGIDKMLAVVVAIVAVIAAVYTAGASLVAAYSAIGSLAATGITAAAAGAGALAELKNAYEQLKPVVEKVEKAQSDINAINEKYKTLKNTLDANPDSARIMVEQTHFDKLSSDKLANFDSTVSAAGVAQSIKDDLINAVHKYFDLVQLRNKKIYEHDAFIVSIQEDARNYYEVGIQIDDLTSMKSIYVQSRQIPQKEAYVGSLVKIQDAQLTLMRHLVWDEKRAQAYNQLDINIINNASLVDIKNNNTATDLFQAHTGVLTQQASYIANTTPLVTKFDPAGHAVQLMLNAEDRTIFGDTRRFRFIIEFASNPFPPEMREIFLTGLKVSTNPATPDFSGRLVHLGRHRFQKVSGEIVEFCSAPTYIGIESGTMTDFKDITGDEGQKIAGLSPFGNWVIICDDNISADSLKKLQTINLTFAGKSRASTQ